MHACVLSRSVVSNSVGLGTVARQAPLSMEFSRQEYRSGLPPPPPGALPNPGIKPTSVASLALAGRFFTTSATWKTQLVIITSTKKNIPNLENRTVRIGQSLTLMAQGSLEMLIFCLVHSPAVFGVMLYSFLLFFVLILFTLCKIASLLQHVLMAPIPGTKLLTTVEMRCHKGNPNNLWQ